MWIVEATRLADNQSWSRLTASGICTLIYRYLYHTHTDAEHGKNAPGKTADLGTAALSVTLLLLLNAKETFRHPPSTTRELGIKLPPQAPSIPHCRTSLESCWLPGLCLGKGNGYCFTSKHPNSVTFKMSHFGVREMVPGFCSFRGPTFNPKHPHDSSQLSQTLAPGDPMSPSGFFWPLHMCKHVEN